MVLGCGLGPIEILVGFGWISSPISGLAVLGPGCGHWSVGRLELWEKGPKKGPACGVLFIRKERVKERE